MNVKYRRDGMTTAELMIVVALSSIVLAGVGTLLMKPQQLVEQSNQIVGSDQQLTLSLNELREQISRSFVMKPGIIRCDDLSLPAGEDFNSNFSLTATLKLDSLVETNTESSKFRFYYSKQSWLGSGSSNSPRITSTSGDKLLVGSIVMVSSTADSALSGVFRVKAVVGAESELELLPEEALPFDCKYVTGRSQSLANIFAGQGADGRVVRLDLLSFVEYSGSPVGTPTSPKPGLWLHEWPSKDAGIVSSMVVENFEKAEFELSWGGASEIQADPNHPDYVAPTQQRLLSSGDFSAKLKVFRKVPLLAGNRDVTRESSLQAKYRVPSSLGKNVAQTSASSVDSPSTASCALALSPADGIYDVMDSTDSAPISERRLLFRVDGKIAGLGSLIPVILGGIEVDPMFAEFQPNCWDLREVSNNSLAPNQINFKTDAQKTRTTTAPQLSGKTSMGASFSMGLSGNSILPIICQVPPLAKVTARMHYFDDTAKRSVAVACSGFDVPIANMLATYVLSSVPTCSRDNATINLGRSVELDNNGAITTTAGPSFYVGTKSCVWDYSATGGASNVVRDCTRTGTEKLTHVYVSPSGLDIRQNAGALEPPPGPAPYSFTKLGGKDVITCGP